MPENGDAKKRRKNEEGRREVEEGNRIQVSLHKLGLAACIKLADNIQTSQAEAKQNLAALLYLQPSPGIIKAEHAAGSLGLSRGHRPDHEHGQMAISRVRNGG